MWPRQSFASCDCAAGICIASWATSEDSLKHHTQSTLMWGTLDWSHHRCDWKAGSSHRLLWVTSRGKVGRCTPSFLHLCHVALDRRLNCGADWRKHDPRIVAGGPHLHNCLRYCYVRNAGSLSCCWTCSLIVYFHHSHGCSSYGKRCSVEQSSRGLTIWASWLNDCIASVSWLEALRLEYSSITAQEPRFWDSLHHWRRHRWWILESPFLTYWFPLRHAFVSSLATFS